MRNTGTAALALFLGSLGWFSNVYAQSLPSAKDVVGLAQKTRFATEALGKEPISAKLTDLNPRFRMLVYFTLEDPIQLSQQRTGAVSAKLEIAGVPEDARVPDGTYYVWIGVIGDKIRSLLVREDGSNSQELFILDEPMSMDQLKAMGLSHRTRVHTGTTTLALPIPGRQPPPPPPPRREPPPPSYRWLCHKVCGTNHGAPCHWVTTMHRDN